MVSQQKNKIEQCTSYISQLVTIYWYQTIKNTYFHLEYKMHQSHFQVQNTYGLH